MQKVVLDWGIGRGVETPGRCEGWTGAGIEAWQWGQKDEV